MGEPEKPFACTLPDCGMTFTNEDHLHVHTKKHDMVLQLGSEQKAAFVADQTPTPTRFIRNCEEVGLFQDLQNVNVNPFDEGFKRAMEAKPGILFLEGAVVTSSSDDVLHTPQMVFPLIDHGDSTSYSTTNNQRNITISRSSSDESGAVKEYETTTISKLTNEVTTISRIVGKQDILDKITTTDDVSIVKHQELAQNKDLVNETSVSYTNNVIKFHSNVEIRKDGSIVNLETTKPVTLISYKDVIKDAASVIKKDVLLTDSNRLQIPEMKIPIMSQRSIDLVVDNLTAECENQNPQKDDKIVKVPNSYNTLNRNKLKKSVPNKSINKGVSRNILKKDKTIGKKQELTEDYEVIIKLPNGKRVRMKAIDDTTNEKSKVVEDETKEKLKKIIAEKADRKSLNNPTLLRVSSLDDSTKISNTPVTARLYPVTILSPGSPILLANATTKIPIPPLNHGKFNKPSGSLKKNVNIKASNDKNNSVKNDITKETADTSKRKGNTDVTIATTVEDNSKNVNGYGNDCVVSDVFDDYEAVIKNKTPPNFHERRCAASKRYRERLKEKMQQQSETIKKLKELNEHLMVENSSLKDLINNHLRTCLNPDDLRRK